MLIAKAILLIAFASSQTQISEKVKFDQVIDSRDINLASINVVNGIWTGQIIYKQREKIGYCVANYIEFDEEKISGNSTKLVLLSLNACEVSKLDDFTVSLKNTPPSMEKLAAQIIKEIEICAPKKCFDNSQISEELAVAAAVNSVSEIFLDGESIVAAIIDEPAIDYFYFSKRTGQLVNHVNAFYNGPDPAEIQ